LDFPDPCIDAAIGFVFPISSVMLQALKIVRLSGICDSLAEVLSGQKGTPQIVVHGFGSLCFEKGVWAACES
jgi:hypothetical protein